MRYLITLTLLTLPRIAHAQGGAGNTAKASGLDKYGGSILGIFGNVAAAALSLVGVIFFILVVYGGFRYIFSRGNEDDAKKARAIIIGATIGLIVIVAAYAITNFLLDNTPGATG